MTASDILNKAASLVAGDRAETHGNMYSVHEDAARLWSIYMGNPITGKDVAVMMTLLKVARLKHGKHNPDNYVDGAGYMGIAGALAEADQ